MSLDNFYKLRKNFIILGLTGKMQSGADQIVKILKQDKLNDEQSSFLKEFQKEYAGVSDSEARKIRRIRDFFEFQENWVKFDVIDYRSVVLMFILHHHFDEDLEKFTNNICNWIVELGNYKIFKTPRFGNEVGIAGGSTSFINTHFKTSLEEYLKDLQMPFKNDTSLLDSLKKHNNDFYFTANYIDFSRKFVASLDSFSPLLRHKLFHIVALNLRRFGTLTIETIAESRNIDMLQHIYIIADVINNLIKIHRNNSDSKDKTAHIIIDRLKNSYELMYFREKYSGFYMVASNREENSRKESIKNKINSKKFFSDKNENLKLIYELDDTEYKVNEFKEGIFEGYDVENCVQKSDYHIVIKEEVSYQDTLKRYNEAACKIKDKKLPRTNEFYVYQPFLLQLLKLVGLIQQPGLITPTYVERIMQIANNAKFNSGCISRQVGAVVTDSNFSVKGIGWNDVPLGQTPCSSRDLRDLEVIDDGFTEFELGKTPHKYKDGKSFHDKLSADFDKGSENIEENLKGRSCAFCFKSFHNAYEAKENQVHTRSLHAEENAMLQISKYGGQGLNGGNLFTTASPCELCSKKAFQLGVKNIFFIDLYPGISQKQILEGGRDSDYNPKVYQFQGVLGRSYQKLYEPFMSIKDETILRSKIKPSVSEKEKSMQLQKLLKTVIVDEDSDLVEYLDKEKDNPDLLKEIVRLMMDGVSSRQRK